VRDTMSRRAAHACDTSMETWICTSSPVPEYSYAIDTPTPKDKASSSQKAVEDSEAHRAALMHEFVRDLLESYCMIHF